MFKTPPQSPRLRHANCWLQLHEINRPLTRFNHPAYARAILARRNEPRHALEHFTVVYSIARAVVNANDVTQGHALLHGEEQVVLADAGYQGASKRPDANGVDWHVALRPGKRHIQKHPPLGTLNEQAEQLKASVRAKVEHPFRVIKRQFGYLKVRYRGFGKNTAQLITLFPLSNIWMVLMHRAAG